VGWIAGFSAGIGYQVNIADSGARPTDGDPCGQRTDDSRYFPKVTFRNRHLLLTDLAAYALSGFLAYTARYEGLGWMATEGRVLLAFLALSIPLRVVIAWALGLYQRVWSLASIAEMERIAAAGVLAGVGTLLVGVVALPALGLAESRLSYGVLLLDALLAAGGMAAPRIAVRIFERRGARARGRVADSIDHALDQTMARHWMRQAVLCWTK